MCGELYPYRYYGDIEPCVEDTVYGVPKVLFGCCERGHTRQQKHRHLFLGDDGDDGHDGDDDDYDDIDNDDDDDGDADDDDERRHTRQQKHRQLFSR